MDLVNTLQEVNALDVRFVSLCEALDLLPRAAERSPGCWPCLRSSSGICCGTA